MTTKQISKNQSENKSLNCFCYTQNIFTNRLLQLLSLLILILMKAYFSQLSILLQVCSSFVRSIVYVQRCSLLKHGAKRGKTHLYHFSKWPNMKDTIFNYVQLDVLWEKFWPCPTPYIFEKKTITQLWGQQRTQKGEQEI